MKYKHLIGSLLGILLCLFIAFQADYKAINYEHLLYILLIITFGLLPTFIFLTVKAEYKLIPLMPLHGISYVFTLGVSSLSDKTTWFDSNPIIIKEALILGLWGLILLNLGYYISSFFISNRKHSIVFLENITAKRSLLIGWTLFCVHLLFVIFPSLGDISILNKFSNISIYISLGILLHFCIKFPSFKMNTFLFIMAVIFTISIQILSASLLTAIYLLVFLIALYWKLKRSIPWTMIIVLTLLVLILNPVKHIYRFDKAIGWQTELTINNKLSSLYESSNTFFEDGGGNITAITKDKSTVNRIAHIRYFADVIQKTPQQVPYWMGETYLPIFTYYIPRLIWPDKPVENIGQRFGHRYGYLHETDLTTSQNLPWLTELYANFGVTGVFIGMFIIGVFFRFLVQKLSFDTTNGVEYTLGLFSVFHLFFADSNFTLLVNNVLIQYIFALLLLRVLTLRFNIGIK